MIRITVTNLFGKIITVTRPGQSVLSNLQASYTDWMHACGGKGRCTTCKFAIVDGIENLGPITPAEMNYRDKNELKTNERLACQAIVSGDIEIAVPPEGKMSHISYSS